MQTWCGPPASLLPEAPGHGQWEASLQALSGSMALWPTLLTAPRDADSSLSLPLLLLHLPVNAVRGQVLAVPDPPLPGGVSRDCPLLLTVAATV